MTFGAAHLVKNQIARDLQQPGRELRACHVPACAFPDSNKNLLRDVFHVRIAAKHSRDRSCDQRLVPLDQFFKRGRIALGNQSHQADVLSVILGARRCFWIGH